MWRRAAPSRRPPAADAISAAPPLTGPNSGTVPKLRIFSMSRMIFVIAAIAIINNKAPCIGLEFANLCPVLTDSKKQTD